jgi:hypothetical protein
MFANVRAAKTRGVVAAAFLALLSACGGGGGDHGPSLDRIELTPVDASAPLGTTQQYVATAVYSDDSTADVTATATWISSATNVATVSDAVATKGLAQTLALGSATITAALDGVSGTTTLTVTAAAPVSLAVTPATVTIAKGTQQQFVATATFTDNSTRDVSSDATWTSGTPAIATVSDAAPTKGLATGVSVGSAQITAIYEGKSGAAALTVSAATVTAVGVTPATPSKPKGTSQQFTAVATLSDGTTQDVTGQASWTSSTSATATVSDVAGSKGLAKAVDIGTAMISAAFSGNTGSADLTVTAAVLQSISVTPSAPSIAKGLTQQFTATGIYTDGTTSNLTTQATWSSSSAAVASISNASGSNGLAQSAGTGSATITATQTGTGISGTATLTVTAAALTRVDVTPATASVPNGTTQQFKATGYYTDNSFQDLTASTTWSVANTAIADISNATASRGLAAAKAVGSTTVTATVGGKTGTATITVTAATLSTIQVTPANQKLAVNYTRQYTATGIYSDNSVRDVTASATWSTTTASFATVSNASDSKGLVTGKSAGTVNVIAAVGSVSGSTPLTVTAATLSSISVTPSGASIAKGLTQQYAATGTFSDSSTQDLTTQVSWSSSTTSVATINNNKGSQGKASTLATGSTTISAVLNSVTGTTKLTVTSAALTKISVTPSPASVAKGAMLQLAATGTYTDGSSNDITEDVTWSSADTSIATVTNGGGLFSSDPYGEVTGVAEGGTSISAVSGSITGSVVLTVTSKAVTSIAVTPANKSVAKGVSVQYVAMATYSDSTTGDISSAATWSSDTTSVATVSNASGSKGLASTVATGSANIKATSSNGVVGSTKLTVTDKVLNSVAVTPANPSIPNGTTQRFLATGTYSDGTTADLTESSGWTSSNTTTADVSTASGTKGLATAKATGTTTIKAAATGTISGSTTLTVTSSTLQQISVTPNPGKVAVGYFQQFTATGMYADGSKKDLTNDVSWDSFSDSVASASNASGSKGQVTGVSAGSTTITATLGSVKASVSITVTSATLKSLAVTPANSSIAAGATLQFTATGTFSDSSTLNMTRQVVWASSNTNAATIDQSGLATAGSSAFSNTTISATKGSGSSAITGSTGLSR